MRTRTPLFWSIALTLAVPGVAAPQATVQFDAANPPFMYDKAGAAAGLYPALFAEAFKRAGVNVTIKAVPWKRAIAAIDAAQAGVGGIYQNSERLKKYEFSQPVFEERIAIYVPAGKETPGKLEDLLGKRVGVLRGWSYGDAFDGAVAAAKLTAEEVESDEANFKKLTSGRLDAVLAIVEAGDAQIAGQALQARVKRLQGLLAVNKVFLAFSRTAAQTELLARFDQAMQAMKKDGTFDQIVKAELAR